MMSAMWVCIVFAAVALVPEPGAGGVSPAGVPVALLAAADAGAELRAAQQRTDAALARRAQLAAAAQAATSARDDAAARVTQLKRAREADRQALEAALRAALASDERAASARAALAGADAVVAREGAALLRLYDRLLVERRRAVDVAAAGRRSEAVAAWRALVAQRDAVRGALAPALRPGRLSAPAAATDLGGLDVDDDDDVEALLEKADLARDLEARLQRRADAVRARIRELRDESAVAADVADAVARTQLFDEEDRRLLLQRDDLGRRAPAPVRDRGDEGDRPPPASGPDPGADADVRDGAAEDVNVAVDAPASAGTTSTTGTAERGYAAHLDGVAIAPRSLAELQSLEQQLQDELRRLQQKKAALRDAVRSRDPR
jgi:hypothetical protein